jgi:sec-independent protein translocase protein TatC
MSDGNQLPVDPLALKQAQLDAEEAAIESTRAPLLEHLAELRDRLLWSIGSIVVGFAVCFVFAEQIYSWLLVPYERAVLAVKGPAGLKDMGLIFTAPLEFFIVKIKLALFGGICISFPMLAYQLYRFIAPGLYSHEKKAFTPFLIVAPILFTIGAAMAYYLVMPMLMQFSLRQELPAGASGDVAVSYLGRVADYTGTMTMLILGFGFCFQLPVVMALIGRAGLVSSKQMMEGARYAIVAIFAIAAVVTPPDIFSQIALGLPMCLLYFIGVWVVRLGEKQRDAEDAAAA